MCYKRPLDSSVVRAGGPYTQATVLLQWLQVQLLACNPLLHVFPILSALVSCLNTVNKGHLCQKKTFYIKEGKKNKNLLYFLHHKVHRIIKRSLNCGVYFYT